MLIYNYQYENTSYLNRFIDTHLNLPYQSLLIQVFTGVLDIDEVKKVLNELSSKLPDAQIIGTSTSGEIMNGQMYDGTISISFALFEKTNLQTFYTSTVDYDSGISMAKEVVAQDTQAIICLSESLKSDPQNFFKGFETVNNEVLIAGGSAGDNQNFQNTFIIKGTQVYQDGMVLCAINSEHLIVNNNSTLNWTPIGSELTITKAMNNIVYEINNRPILDVYKYYFGDDIVKNLPTSIVDFPLIKNENGTEIARSLLMLLEDESFLYAGHFIEGDKVRFSIGNVDEVLQNAHNFSEEVSHNPTEGIFVYSCSVRRNFLKKQLNNEFRLLDNVAPSSGFLTYGEFFNTGKSNQVLNVTTTILSLSESTEVNVVDDKTKLGLRHTPLKSLIHLINVTQGELENKVELLQKTKGQLIESEKMASLGSLVSGIAHEVNTPLGVSLTGISQIEYEVKKLQKAYENEELSEEALKDYISTMKDLSRTIHNSLDNATKLIKSFKHISVDQHSGEARSFCLAEYTDDLILSLKSELKKKQIKTINSINKDIMINSFPGTFSQIFSNLILNSLNHAFDSNNDNLIEIYIDDKEPLVIHYKDNGKGISQDIEKKIFDPFFTTARGKGGSGLGLNIVYNLVTQKLNGNIELIHDNTKGVHFIITLAIPLIKDVN